MPLMRLEIMDQLSRGGGTKLIWHQTHLQFTHEERYGVWSWYDQQPTPTMHDGKTEALTVTDGYPSVSGTATGLNNWAAEDAGGKNDGVTYRRQWEMALRTKPLFLFVNQWNEFVPPDQYNANRSNDLEPTILKR